MKDNFKISVVITINIIGVLFTNCSKKDSAGKALSSKEETVVSVVAQNLPDDQKLISFQIVEGSLPTAIGINLYDDRNKLLNALNAYRLGREFSRKEVDPIVQNEIISNAIPLFEKTISNYIENKSNKNYILVMGIVEKDDGITREIKKNLYGIDLETNKLAHTINNVTRYNEDVAIIETLKDGSFVDFFRNKDSFNYDSLAQTVSDPVLKFILEPVKE